MFRKQHPQVGADPGTLVISAESPRTKVRAITFCADKVEEKQLEDLSALDTLIKDQRVAWIDVQGFGDESALRKIAETVGLHPLAMEDIVNVPHRPSAAVYEDKLLIIVRSLFAENDGEIEMEQVSILIGPRYVITFQQQHGDALDSILRRLRDGRGSIRNRSADFLGYSILDTIIDGYYPALEDIGEILTDLEEEVVNAPTPATLSRLHRIKNSLTQLRRALWPQRDAIHSLFHEDVPFFGEDMKIYLRDTYDHCIQTAEVVEMYRETIAELVNTYLSSMANRTNEIMKVLTIMASTFIPLTFMVGIYGMNFEHMPELHARWAYPLLWMAMGTVALGMLFYFRSKGWIGGGK